jgi:hypothetical protein
MSIMKDFDGNMQGLLAFSRAVDKELCNTLQKLTDESNVGYALGELYVALKVATIDDPPAALFSLFQLLATFGLSFLHGRKTLLPANSLRKILVTLHRMIPLARQVSDVYLTNRHDDDEIFKPSNIDKNVILDHIEQAILVIESAAIDPEQKAKLLSHLNQTKQYLAGGTIPWRNVIGGLVVVATILTGIADAPHACRNIHDAIQYILGISIEKITPLFLPAPPRNDAPDDAIGVTKLT